MAMKVTITLELQRPGWTLFGYHISRLTAMSLLMNWCTECIGM